MSVPGGTAKSMPGRFVSAGQTQKCDWRPPVYPLPPISARWEGVPGGSRGVMGARESDVRMNTGHELPAVAHPRTVGK